MDFDGVVHSYKSGWKGISNIPDEPVVGILEFIVETILGENDYEIQIYSARSKKYAGRRAMKEWLTIWLYREIETINDIDSKKWKDMWQWLILNDYQSMDTWDVHVTEAVDKFIKKIKFPRKKPSAYITVDDRCICFDGNADTLIDKINNFKPWYK